MGHKAVNCKSQIVNRESDKKPSSFGFTSIELIIVIIALSILAGTAVVSFRVSDQDKSTIAADQLIADIQYVQMRAMGVGIARVFNFVTMRVISALTEYWTMQATL